MGTGTHRTRRLPKPANRSRRRIAAADLAGVERAGNPAVLVLLGGLSMKVAIGHFGMPNRGGWPGQLQLCHHRNVYMECGGIVWLYRHEGTAFPQAVGAIRHAADKVGVEKLMWGSDWPRTMVDFTYKQSLDFVAASGAFSDAELDAFLGSNAARLYGLEPHEPAARIALITEG